MGNWASNGTKADWAEQYRLIGESEAFIDCMQKVSRLAKIDRPVLIIGERGTGKELVAARLHYLSNRWEAPRICINCAAFAENLLESELFGYEPGAFTGAQKLKPGRFELANGGTLFLDELAQSPLALQEKLLRILEYQEFERVGGTETLRVDVRVIAATNKDLPNLCKQGKFKKDLLDRMSFEVITLPPLRRRTEDIPLLAGFFSRRMAIELNYSRPPLFSNAAMDSLLSHPWPGNIRELKNAVERATCLTEGEPVIEHIVFDPFESPYRNAPLDEKKKKPSETKTSDIDALILKTGLDLEKAKQQVELEFIRHALETHHFHLGKAASTLKISYHQLRRLLGKHKIEM